MTNIERLEDIIVNSLDIKDGVPIPSIIEISPIDSCNRACSFCPRSNQEVAPNNPLQMDLGTIIKLNEELKKLKFKGLVVFSGFSEPFMYKHLISAVRLLSETCKVDVVTNGDYLTKENLNNLISLGINKLLISVYEEKRFQAIENIVLGVNAEKIDIRKRFDGFKLTNRGGTLNNNSQNRPCYYPAYSVMIDWNGDVLLCPQDWNRKVKFGNINYDSLFNIWASPYMIKFRKDLFLNRSKSPCNKCDANGTVHGTHHKEIWLANS